jgi:hypothetical protein
LACAAGLERTASICHRNSRRRRSTKSQTIPPSPMAALDRRRHFCLRRHLGQRARQSPGSTTICRRPAVRRIRNLPVRCIHRRRSEDRPLIGNEEADNIVVIDRANEVRGHGTPLRRSIFPEHRPQGDLAKASGVSEPTIARLESEDGPLGRSETGERLVAALEKAGIEFIDENGGGAGVRMRRRGKR